MSELMDQLSRREMLRRSSLTVAGLAAAGISLPLPGLAATPNSRREKLGKIQIGLVADVHQDIIHDGWARMRVFIDEMKEREVDALVQLGDFALPHSWNQPFLDVWNEYQGPKHHLLGNHDMDHGFSKEQTMKWWRMPERFYSFDVGGWHFVVLDGNDKNPGKWSGYVRYVAQDQRTWLTKDLAATEAPTMVFSHQQLESNDGVANSSEVRKILETANEAAGWPKIYACLCGHHHSDGLTEIAGIRYIHVNSMSYKWVGGGANKRQRFAKHVDHSYPWVSHTVPYRDPLYTTLLLDPETGTMSIEGKETRFIPPTPQKMGLPGADRMTPAITARKVKIL